MSALAITAIVVGSVTGYLLMVGLAASLCPVKWEEIDSALASWLWPLVVPGVLIFLVGKFVSCYPAWFAARISAYRSRYRLPRATVRK